jgi:hypothetical protein
VTNAEGRIGRLASYARLSTKLAYLDDDQLGALVGGQAAHRGWGLSGPAELDGDRLFVKRIPVTDLELEQRFSTRNQYDIPSYYSYGVGSAGFGAFRELAAHVKTTNWVLHGAAEGFPMMYHFRLLPSAGGGMSLEGERLAGYVRHWNGNEAIERYMMDRSSAVTELVVVLEHVPHTMNEWLHQHLAEADDVVEQLVETISFLRRSGVVHFDAHFANVLTDGERHYLTDFGLVLDADFSLSADERTFLRRHLDYDYGEALLSVGSQLMWLVQRLPEDERTSIRRAFGIEDDKEWYRTGATFIKRVEDLAGVTPIEPAYLELVKRYRAVMLFMDDFLGTLRANPRKDTAFDEETLRGLLTDAGVPL